MMLVAKNGSTASGKSVKTSIRTMNHPIPAAAGPTRRAGGVLSRDISRLAAPSARLDCDSLLVEKAGDGLRRLRAAPEPEFDPLFLQPDAQLLFLVRGIIGPELFE